MDKEPAEKPSKKKAEKPAETKKEDNLKSVKVENVAEIVSDPETDTQIVEALNQKDETYYAGLLQKFLTNPGSMKPEEMHELRTSSFLNDMSNHLDNLKVKKVEPEEARELHKAETFIKQYLERIGQLEFEKDLMIKKAMQLEENKTEYLNQLRAKYRIPLEVDFAVDIQTREIKIQR